MKPVPAVEIMRRSTIHAQARDPDAPLAYEDLRARGYTKPQAYGLLRRHGVRVPGGRRKRISRDVLARIERGEVEA